MLSSRPLVPAADDVIIGTPSCSDSYFPVPWLNAVSVTMLLVGLALLAVVAYRAGRRSAIARNEAERA